MQGLFKLRKVRGGRKVHQCILEYLLWKAGFAYSILLHTLVFVVLVIVFINDDDDTVMITMMMI